MSERLDEQEMEAVLMHELMHVRRQDNLIGSLQMLASCIFWFHPLIWLIDRRLLEERELACDEAVLRMGGAPLSIVGARMRVMIDEENRTQLSAQQAAEYDLIVTQFDVTLANQTGRKVAAIAIEYSNPGLPGDGGAGVATLVREIEIEPFASQHFDRSTIHHFMALKSVPDVAQRFAFRIIGVAFESGPAWHSPDPDSARVEKIARMFEKYQEALKRQAESGVYEMSEVSTRPVITYKEPAGYTDQAQQNRTTGQVVLSVVFGSDGKIGGIKVVRGLPDGLTEQAIEATHKIRFKPATKDGQAVSVRARLEFNFSLE